MIAYPSETANVVTYGGSSRGLSRHSAGDHGPQAVVGGVGAGPAVHWAEGVRPVRRPAVDGGIGGMDLVDQQGRDGTEVAAMELIEQAVHHICPVGGSEAQQAHGWGVVLIGR